MKITILPQRLPGDRLCYFADSGLNTMVRILLNML